MGVAKQLLSSEVQTWATPISIFKKLDKIFNFKLDPCAAPETAKCKKYFTEADNGLKQDWSAVGNAFVNPPFGREIREWVKKCLDESAKGITVVMLIPARPDTTYWHDYIFQSSSCVCFVKGRIKFGNKGKLGQKDGAIGAPFPSAIVVFGYCNAGQIKQLRDFGKAYPHLKAPHL